MSKNAQYFIGLDIGTSKVRCAVGMFEEKPTEKIMNVIGTGTSVNQGMRKGNVIHVEDVAKAIGEAVSEAERMAGIKIGGATINVNGAHLSSQPSKGVIAISNPSHIITEDDRLRVEEAASLISLPANRDIIQVFAKNYSIDGQENIKDPIGMQGLRLEVETLVVTAGLSMLRSLDSALQQSEMTAHHHSVSSLAAAEAVLSRKQKESGTAVLDIGAGTTNIVVIEEGEVVYVGVIPVGSQNLTNDLAIGLKADLEIAESVKIAHASLNFDNPPAEDVSIEYRGKRYHFNEKIIRLVVEARMEELFEQIDRELKKIGKSRRLPGGVVIVGASANIPGLANFAKEKLQLPAKIGRMIELGGLIDTINSPEYATVVGLMMMDMLLSGQSTVTATFKVPNNLSAKMAKKLKRIIKL
jgi:cell division protein FtsA